MNSSLQLFLKTADAVALSLWRAPHRPAIRLLAAVLLTVGLATFLAPSPVKAQAQGRTPPAGFMTTSLAPSPDGVKRVYTPFSVPLHAAIVASATVTAASGNTLTFTGTTLPDLTTKPYLVHVTSAANVAAIGRSFLVMASTPTSVTAGNQLSSFLSANDQVLIYAANTLGSIFGSTDQTVKLQGATSATGADVVYLWNGASWSGYFYSPGTGWLLDGDSTYAGQNNLVIFPDRAMLVGRISTRVFAPTDVLLTGTAPQNNQSVSLAAPGSVFAANPLPTPVTLAQFGLANNAGWQDGATAGDADILCALQANNWQSFYHRTGYGWILDSDPNYGLQDTYAVPGTSGVWVIRQSSSSSPVVQVPLTYTVN